MTSRPVDRERALPPADPRPRQPVALVAGRTGIVFTWCGDRWGHAIELDGRLLATSLEHTADSRDPSWPASPPLVELSTATTASGTAIVAVGRVGRAHFSASFVPHAAAPDTILVEVACRIPAAPGWLGSTYAVAGRPVRIAAGPPAAAFPATVRWSYVAGPAGLRPLPPAETADGR